MWPALQCGAPAWIASEDAAAEFTVAVQQADPSAPVHRYRRLLQVRKANPDLFNAPFESHDAPDAVAVIRRGATFTVANLSALDHAVTLPEVEGGWSLAYASSDSAVSLDGSALTVPPEQSVILVAGAG